MLAPFGTLNRSDLTPFHKDSAGLAHQISVLDRATGADIATARFYQPGRSASSPVYACIWVSGDSVFGCAGGKARGYGYHKESAALANAIDALGFTLSEPINGVGHGAMIDALEAIARAIAPSRHFITFEAHP